MISFQNPRNAVIAGYVIYFKPFDSPDDYDKREIQGHDLEDHIITNLQPNTQYAIKMQCFNDKGASLFSNTVVKKTLCEICTYSLTHLIDFTSFNPCISKIIL